MRFASLAWGETTARLPQEEPAPSPPARKKAEASLKPTFGLIVARH